MTTAFFFDFHNITAKVTGMFTQKNSKYFISIANNFNKIKGVASSDSKVFRKTSV